LHFQVEAPPQSGKSFLGSRNRAMILTFIDTGLRLSELAHIGIVDCESEPPLTPPQTKFQIPYSMKFSSKRESWADVYICIQHSRACDTRINIMKI
jgi:site-specific recombinase XerD